MRKAPRQAAHGLQSLRVLQLFFDLFAARGVTHNRDTADHFTAPIEYRAYAHVYVHGTAIAAQTYRFKIASAFSPQDFTRQSGTFRFAVTGKKQVVRIPQNLFS